MKTLTLLMRQQMEKEGLSLREAAEKVDVAHSTLDRALQGFTPNIETLIKICAWLGVSPGNIIAADYGTDDNSLASQIAALVETDPELKDVFNEAMARVTRGEMTAEALRDLIRYSAWRLGQV